MSITTTVQWNGEGTESLETTLHDYRMHLTGGRDEQECVSTRQENETVSQPIDSPANWPTQYRRIPPYRPINRNLDLTERPNGSSRAELVFVTVMLNGIRLQSVRTEHLSLALGARLTRLLLQGLVRAWEYTGGHWYPQLTRYKIGGEW